MRHIKIIKSISVIISLFLITSCFNNSAMKPEDFKNKEPRLIIEEYLSGNVKAWGVLQNRSGKVTRQFTAQMQGKFENNILTLEEDFHWKDGEKHFRNCLVDFNEANNVAQWQWVAGSGADAAPYFRIFNPILQGEKFDKDGNYVKKWVPELKNVPSKFIHRPWEMDEQTQKSINIKKRKNINGNFPQELKSAVTYPVPDKTDTTLKADILRLSKKLCFPPLKIKYKNINKIEIIKIFNL